MKHFERRPSVAYIIWVGGRTRIQWNADLARRLHCREEEKKGLGP